MSDFYHEQLFNENEAMVAALATYDEFHRGRFEYLLRKVRTICPDPTASVLDVGVSSFSLTLSEHYNRVATLDIRQASSQHSMIGEHLVYDLNDAQNSAPMATEERFDIIVLAEVIEHLHTAPELVLSTLKGVLKSDGFIVIQTPNAAALYKRLLLLAGFNPYERIRISVENPGHFREYTKRELVSIVESAGLVVQEHEFKDYFGTNLGSKFFLNLQRALAKIVPSFARGQTLVASNRPAALG